MDGLDVARAIRNQGLTTPVLVLTARADEVDLVVGLDAGADDYVTKPFRLAELLARVRALLRRTHGEPGRRGRAARAGRPRRRRRAPRLPGRPRAAPDRQGVRPAARPRAATPAPWSPARRSCARSGARTRSARPRRSTCTCRGCAASSATTRTHPRYVTTVRGLGLPLRDRRPSVAGCAARVLQATIAAVTVAVLLLGFPLAIFGARYIHDQEVARVETRAQDLLSSAVNSYERNRSAAEAGFVDQSVLDRAVQPQPTTSSRT